jgi:hypothetical protein
MMHPVFGGAQATKNSAPKSADLSISIDEAYETNVFDGSYKPDPTVFRAHGFYSELKADGDYARNGEHLKFAATAGSNLRYYQDLQRVVPVNQYLGAGLTADFRHRTTISVNQTVAYTPSFFSGAFPTAAAPVLGLVSTAAPVPGLVSTAGTDYSLNTLRSYAYGTSAFLNQRLTPHGSVSFDTGFQYIDFAGGPTPLKSFKSSEVGGHYAYRFNRSGTLRLGYTYQEGQYLPAPAREHGIDIGVEINRALSSRRRSTVAFNFGSTFVNGPVPADNKTGFSPRGELRFIGDGAASYDLGGTWRARGAVRRGVMVIEGFSNPLLVNGYAGEITGFVTRRLDVLVSAGYARGESSLVVNNTDFRTATGDIRLRYGLTRTLAVYAEYSNYSYIFGQGVLPVPSLLPLTPRAERNGLHVGLALWTGTRQR